MPKIRLFPVLLFVAALMLSVKLGSVWSLISDGDESPAVPTPVAQVASAVAQDEETENQDEDAFADEEDPLFDVADEIREGSTPLEMIEEETPDIGDISRMSPAEIRLVHDLAERRVIMDQREQRLDEREAVLAAAEQKLLERQSQLEILKRDIEDLLAKFDTAQDQQTSALRETYEKMKPKSAAAIFNDLDIETMLGVIRGIAPRRLAPILQAMNPERARIVTQELARREELPEVPR